MVPEGEDLAGAICVGVTVHGERLGEKGGVRSISSTSPVTADGEMEKRFVAPEGNHAGGRAGKRGHCVPAAFYSSGASPHTINVLEETRSVDPHVASEDMFGVGGGDLAETTK